MQKSKKERKRRKRKAQQHDNPFEDFSFWLTLATTDFQFFNNKEKTEDDTDKGKTP